MTQSQDQKRVVLTAVAFSALGMVGLFHTILGTALPAIRLSLEMDMTQAGLLGSASWLGFTAAVFSRGALSDIFRRHMILMLACSLIGLSAILFGRWRLFPANCLLLGILGAGTGMIVSSSSALVMGLYPGKEGMIMNLHPSFYALGAIAGPLPMGYGLREGWHWRWMYWVGGVLMLALAGSFATLQKEDAKKGPAWSGGALLHLLTEKNLIPLILITLFAIGTQNGLYYWLVSFLKEVRSLPIFWAGLGLSLFSVGMTTGRLISGWMVPRLGNTSVLLILLVILNVALFLLLNITLGGGTLVICFIAGLACSGLFPGLLALGGINFPQLSGTTMGILGTAAGIGSTFMPWVISVVSQPSSLKAGLHMTLLAALIALGLVIVFYRRFQYSEAPSSRGRRKVFQPVL